MTDTISTSTTVVAKDGLAFCELKGGVALLDLEQSVYFSLNSVAAAIWGHIQSPISVEAIVTAIGNEFEVEDSDLTADVIALIRDFVGKDLVHVSA